LRWKQKRPKGAKKGVPRDFDLYLLHLSIPEKEADLKIYPDIRSRTDSNLPRYLVGEAMTAILKILALLTSLATTILVIVASVRQGLIIVWAIFSVVKIVVVVLFVALLLVILYLLLTKKSDSPDP